MSQFAKIKPVEALLGYGIGFEYQGKFRWIQRRGLQKHWVGKDCHDHLIVDGKILGKICSN